MTDKPIAHQFGDAYRASDIVALREIVSEHPEVLQKLGGAQHWLRDAASKDNIAMMALMVELGGDIHAPRGSGSPPSPEGVIDDAAGNGAIKAVRWLLERGAKINFQFPEFPGESRCFPLTGAILDGRLDIVKLLVEEGGANINACWLDLTPLSYAITYGKKEIAAYLCSKGALEPHQLSQVPAAVAPASADTSDAILEHVAFHLGAPKELSLREVVPGDPPISILHVPPKGKRKWHALVTSGMSQKAMAVPQGAEDYRFAELVIYLPPAWPLTAKALQDLNTAWPIHWLRKLARYPHDHNTWLGGSAVVIANEEPPQPLASNTKLSCILAMTEPSAFGWLTLADGKRIAFYTLIPLYVEERDLEKKHGTQHLIQLFDQHRIPTYVDVQRPNVASLGKAKKK